MTTDPWCESAAAYVLGALPAGERRPFEAHLADCAGCQTSVRELAGIPGLLGKVSPTDLADPPAVSDLLLPRLLAQVRRRRLRRRVLTGLAAAAAVVAVLTTFQLTTQEEPARPPSVGLVMQAVAPSPITAKAALTSKAWGTAVVLTCSYEHYADPAAYTLVATSRAGQTQPVATWEGVPDRVSTINGSVGWPAEQIARLEIQSADGTTVLQLDR